MILTFCTHQAASTFGINEIGSIATTIIAALTLVLAYYVFVYQRNKDNENDVKTAEIQRKNIKLQWFKELIIQPKINEVFAFYSNLNNLKDQIYTNELSDDDKINLINFIKHEQSKLRKAFLDLIQFISIELHNDLSLNLDNLTDSLTISISDDELKLHNGKTYEREISNKIQNSYSRFLSSIYNYEGEK